MAEPAPARMDKRVYKVLRECCDSPTVLFASSVLDPLLWRKGNSRGTTKVVLVCTEYYTYLLKRSGYKLQTRWANRRLTVSVQGAVIVLSCASDPAAPQSSAGKQAPLPGATLVAGSAAVARQVEEAVSRLVAAAGRAAALLALEEAGAAADDSDDSGRDLESSGSEAEAGALPGATVLPDQRGPTHGNLEELLRLAPARYIALTSLVDGEFADYTTLKNAYLRGEEDQVMQDLDVFIHENEGRVEALCQQHYPAFINAAQQCLAISAQDAEVVGEHLSVANAMVKASVVEIQQMASEMVNLRTTCGNLDATRSLLHRCLAIVDYLETAESQVLKLKLRGAVVSLRELVRLAAPIAHFTLGEYVLHMRVPALTREVLNGAVQQLNTWLNRLRQEALPVGRAALEWEGSNSPGRVAKEVVFADSGGDWWIAECFVPSERTLAPFAMADTVQCLCNGAGIQSVFEELRRGEEFRRHYCEGREQQARVDLCNAPFQTQGVEAEKLVKNFEDFCCSTLGFILIEDIVHTATSPQVQSCSEILRTWDLLASAIASRLTMVSGALVGQPHFSGNMLHIVKTMRLLLRHSMESVKSVELSPLILLKVMEAQTDSLVSVWLQETCMQLTADVVQDPMLALVAENPADFDRYVAAFHLDQCPDLELHIPSAFTGSPVTLPFGEMVPKVGAAALGFLQRCYSVLILDAASAVRHSERNNVDEMLLKYLSVVFRTVVEAMRQLDTSGQQSVLKCAIFVSSCAVMPAIVSCVEQEFLVHWSSDMAMRKQKMGSPVLLKAAADWFSKPMQEGTEKMLAACMADVKTRLALSATIIYWYKQMDLRQSDEEARAAGECFTQCILYILQLIPQLSAMLPGSMVRSVIGTAIAHAGQGMQNSLETALKRAYAGSDRNFNAMRACVVEFETQCANGIPRWQQQLRIALPGVTAATRFPLDAHGAAENARAWIDAKEAYCAEERANQPQLVTAMEDAGKAFSRGFQAIGKSMATPFKRGGKDHGPGAGGTE